MSLEKGRIKRDQAIEQVSSGEDKEAYLIHARKVLVEVVSTHTTFTTDDIRDRAPVPEDMDPRVLGGLIMPAIRSEAIVKVVERRNTRYTQAHARDQTLWTRGPGFALYRILHG